MSTGIPFGFGVPGAFTGLRRSVVDPETGNPVVTSAPTGAVRQRAGLLPFGRTDDGSLVPAVPQGVFDAIDAARFPGQVLRGEKDVFDPATGHVSDEAVGAASGIAGLAMTGSMPFRVPRGALRSFGGAAAKDDPFAALEAGLANLKPEAPAPGPRLLDPNAKTWDVYHGSGPGQDFQRFDPNAGSTRAEHGGVFFSPDAETASGYAGSPRGGAEAGGRVFRASVEPGKTAVFDLAHLVENDPTFNARARQSTVQHEGATWGPVFDDAMAQYTRNRAEHRDLSAQAEAMGYPASRPDGVPYGYGHIGAAVQMAKEQGLDTAILRGLGEHGGDDQVVALTPGRVRSHYAPDQLLYQGAPAAIGAGALAATLGAPGDAQAAPSPSSGSKGPSMTSGIPFGLSVEDMARLFGKAPMGAPQGFTGTSSAVAPAEEPAPAPLALRVAPPAAQPGPGPDPSPQSPAPMSVPLPPRRPFGFGPPDTAAPAADMPAPDAVPTSGNFPALPAPSAPSPAAPAPAVKPAGADDGFDLSGALKRFTDRGGGDLLVGLGTGLMSTHGFGNGLAAGFQNAQKAEALRATTGLANAELGLKQRKLAQETQALGGNAAIIKRAFPNLSDTEALAAGSNSGQVTEALKILRDPNHGTGVPAGYRQRADGAGYEPIPGSEADPATKKVLAQAQAEGAAAGGNDGWQQAKTPDGGTILYNKSDPTKTQVLVPGQPVRPANAEERAAYGIPSTVPVKMTPTGPQAIGGGGTNVNVDLGKKANQGLDDLTNTKISESYDKSQGAIGTLKAIGRQKQAIDGGMITGWGADYQTQARSMLAKVLGLDPASVVNSETFDAAASQKGAELAKAISQAGHTTNMDLQLGKTIAGGDRSKIEQSIRNAIDAQEQLARDTIDHHNDFLGRYGKVVPDTADRLGVFRVEAPETYQYRQTPAAAPDRSAVEAELRRRKVIQ